MRRGGLFEYDATMKKMANAEKMAIQRRTSRRRGSRKVTKNRAQEVIQRKDKHAVYTAKRTG